MIEFVHMSDGSRRLAMRDSIADLPSSVPADCPLPVQCWVKNTGMYEMAEPGAWRQLYSLEDRRR